jgi:hypothetical protein
MAKKRTTTKKGRTFKDDRSWSVQDVAKFFGLSSHHTRRLIHEHIAIASDGAGTMKIPHSQMLVLRDRYVETIEPEAVEQMARIRAIKKIK